MWLSSVLLLATLTRASVIQHPLIDRTDNVKAACTALQHLLPHLDLFWPDEDFYHRIQSAYWLGQQQTDTKPRCIVSPATTSQVSTILHVIDQYNASFSIASGQHSTVTGASNINAGLSVVMAQFDDIAVFPTTESAALGVATRWGEVYQHLGGSYGLSINGARDASVGVGGFVLGCGHSWYSNRYGWACDSVLSFEVVLASGDVVTASDEENAELFWALKGGGSNFGIVTRVTMQTFQEEEIYVTFINWIGRAPPERLWPTIEAFNEDAVNDTGSEVLVQYHCGVEPDSPLGTTTVIGVNTGGNTTTAQLKRFEDLPSDRPRSAVLRMGGLSLGFVNGWANGMRKVKWTLTVRSLATEDVHRYLLLQMARNKANDLSGDKPEPLMGYLIQPLSVPMLSRSENALGLSADDGPLLLISQEIWWNDHREDDFHEKTAYNMWAESVEHFEALGTLHPFIWMNYAASWQEPIKSYGAENVRRMREVKKKYDPSNMFGRLQTALPNGFKIDMS